MNYCRFKPECWRGDVCNSPIRNIGLAPPCFREIDEPEEKKAQGEGQEELFEANK